MVGHTANKYIYEKHSDWAQVNARGEVILLEHAPLSEGNYVPEWPQICINSPYFELIKEEVRELIRVRDSIISKVRRATGIEDLSKALDVIKKAHEEGKVYAGVDVENGKIVDMEELGVLEPLRVKTQAIELATEVAVMLLRIDDVIAAKELSKEKEGKEGAEGMGGMGEMGGF